MRRSKLEITTTILKICLEGANKTKIVYQANLNFKTAQPLLDQLIQNGLISSRRETTVIYNTTEKGIEFIENFEQALGLLGQEVSDDFSELVVG